MNKLPEKEKLVTNFNRCLNWEEKYLYIIELGSSLPQCSGSLYTKENIISGCQSQVWIKVIIHKNKAISFQGDSNSMIVKGLIAILFILFRGLSTKEIINFNVSCWLEKLNLINHLTPSRMQGMKEIICFIYNKVKSININ